MVSAGLPHSLLHHLGVCGERGWEVLGAPPRRLVQFSRESEIPLRANSVRGEQDPQSRER